MAKRGCKPKSVSELSKTGSRRLEKRLPSLSVIGAEDPDVGSISVTHLGDVGRTEIQRINAHLDAYGIRRRIDDSVIVATASIWEVFLDAVTSVCCDGAFAERVMHSGKSRVAEHPGVKIATATLSHLRQLWGDLGMTPMARRQLRVMGDDEKDKAIADWLYGNDGEVRVLEDDEDY